MSDVVCEIKQRWNYDRFSIVPVEVIMPMIHEAMDLPEKHKRREVYLGQSAHVTSLRLRTFALRGLTCVSCGLTATFFALERGMRKKQPIKEPYHLNLWGIAPDGEEILFTHDHVLARGLGGADSISNTQTMCSPCNAIKGEKEKILIEERRHGHKISHTFP
jgi:hypothetical protein